MSYGALTSSLTIIPHSFPLCFCLPVSLSVLYYTVLNGTKLTTVPWRRLSSAKCLIVFFHNTSLNPKRGVKKHLEDITDIRFQRSLRSSYDGAGGGGGRGEGDRVDKNLFVSEWRPALPGQHPGELAGVRHFSTLERCWDIEGLCGESYWVTVMGRAGVHVCLMAWGICKAIRGPAALVFLPSVPGLYRRRVTPALSPLTLRQQLRTYEDPNLSVHTQHYQRQWETDAA